MKREIKVCDMCPDGGNEICHAFNVCDICGKDLCNRHSLLLNLIGTSVKKSDLISSSASSAGCLSDPIASQATIGTTTSVFGQGYPWKYGSHYSYSSKPYDYKETGDKQLIVCQTCLVRLREGLLDKSNIDMLKKIAMCGAMQEE